jgi:outer membrane protein OmpA-like peptidoglycan-associated protein
MAAYSGNDMKIFSGKKLLNVLIPGVLAISGCASDRVVLLPNADGSRSSVILTTTSGEHVLDHPYDSVSISQRGTIVANRENAESVQARYGQLLAAQPKRPVSYVVYFASGNNEITTESLAAIEQMKTDVKSRTAPQITVIGHTDRVGTLEANDALSLKRAQLMRDMLIAGGIPETQIEASGSGEREPLVQTDDEVAEPMNRRVEINVR